MSSWRTINISPVERVARIVVGVMGVIAGTILLSSPGSAAAAVLEVLLVLAGLDLLITGATGHCPLYARLGHVSTALRGRSS